MKRLTVLALALSAALAMLCGCAPEAPPPQAGEPPPPVRLMAMSGPTAMGMAGLLAGEAGSGAGADYRFEMAADPAAVTAALLKGEADIAAIPANLAAVLYGRTEGGVRVIALNTLGVLYLVENGESVNSFADLRGKTLFASGKGAVPELILNHLLAASGLDPARDLTLEFKAEPAEALAALTEGAVAMLPQPFVAAALRQNADLRVAADLTDAWEQAIPGGVTVTGVTVVRTAFADENPQAVAQFLADYRASVAFVNTDTDAAARLIGEMGIVPAEVAREAIAACHLVCIEGDDMRSALSGFLAVLAEGDADSVGGALPDESFYYPS